ncbi:MAG: AAA family ATPase [Nitrosarchaeum sp.]|nr:AAA family ATPase [Nitrosarchaeum sp.]
MVLAKTGFRGKNYITSKLTEQKLRITKQQLNTIKQSKEINRYFYNKKTGEVLKFDLKSVAKNDEYTYNPAIARKFGTKKRIGNKAFLDPKLYNKNKKLKVILTDDGISWGTPVKLLYQVDYYILFDSSGTRYPSNKNEFLTFITETAEKKTFDNEDELQQYLEEQLRDSDAIQNLHKRAVDFSVVIERILAITENYTIMQPTKIGLREEKPLKINLFNSEIKIKDNGMNNCVKNLLYQYYYKDGKGISKQTIDNLGDGEVVTVKEITDFCKNYDIKTIAYDINKNVISRYVPSKRSKAYKSLIYIAYNNHIYPIHNSYLTRFNLPKYEQNRYISFLEIEDELIEILEKGSLPDNISIIDRSYDHDKEIAKLGISSFVFNNILYHSNEDYSKINNIAKSFGITDKIDPKVNLSNIGDYIEKLYIKKCIKSFFPYSINFNGGFNYVNDKYEEMMDKYYFTTIDNNKHYSNALYKLPFLVKTDIRLNNHKFIKDIPLDKIEIKDEFIYVANPKVSTILMPSCDYYIGYQLKYCAEQGIEFTLLEELESEQLPNYFVQMIDDLLKKVDSDTFKKIMNRHIGRMEGGFGEKSYKKFSKIANDDELKVSQGYVYKLSKKFNLVYECKKTFYDIYNKRPIRQQILFEARKIVYEKMQELELDNNKIMEIRTDAITFASKTKIKVEVSDKFGEWKEENKEKQSHNPKDVYNSLVTFENESLNENNIIWIDYAGSGKTHYIINTLIPKLDKQNSAKAVFQSDKGNYIVLTPSHSACKDYRKNKINCSVIQKYTYSYNNLPEEDFIVVDEIGMVDRQGLDLLIKATLVGKTVFAFGDFKQLPPVSVGKPLNKEIFLDLLYSEQTSLGTNYRNDFTKKYYNSLINNTDNKFLSEEVKKFSSKSWKDADSIICYKNESRQKYNKLMLEHLALEKFDIGSKIVCKTNDLAEYEIYNNFYYTITDKDSEFIEIYDGMDYYNIEPKDLSHFDSGYARTIHNIQGESVESFYFAPEDYKHLDGTMTYTIISRLKTK